MQKNETKKPTEWTKQIGSTTYRVNVHFSQTGKESATDKVKRLIKREVSQVA